MAHILVLDDSPSILQMVAQWLTSAGHRVVTRSSGLHAGRLLRTTTFDLVVTDIYMPDVDGMQLLALLRKECPKLPCIAMSSAEGNYNLLGVAKQLGAAVTLRKPFAEEALLTAVATVLGDTNQPDKRLSPTHSPASTASL